MIYGMHTGGYAVVDKKTSVLSVVPANFCQSVLGFFSFISCWFTETFVILLVIVNVYLIFLLYVFLYISIILVECLCTCKLFSPCEE